MKKFIVSSLLAVLTLGSIAQAQQTDLEQRVQRLEQTVRRMSQRLNRLEGNGGSVIAIDPSKICTVKNSYGWYSVTKNDQAIASNLTSMADALVALVKFTDAGLCSVQAKSCDMKNSYGWYSITMDGADVASNMTSVDDALKVLSSLRDAGLCQ